MGHYHQPVTLAGKTPAKDVVMLAPPDDFIAQIRAFAAEGNGKPLMILGDVLLFTSTQTDADIGNQATLHQAAGAAALAEALRQEGIAVRLVSLIGRDITGQLLRQAVRQIGLDDDLLIEDPSIATLHQRDVASAEECPTSQDLSQTCQYSRYGLAQLRAVLGMLIPDCQAVVIEDGGWGLASEEVEPTLQELAVANAVPTFFADRRH